MAVNIIHIGLLLYTVALTFGYQTATCGDSVLYAKHLQQYLTSPGYPGKYERNVHCVWTIRSSQPTLRLRVQLLFLDIEDESLCVFDKLTAYDGDSEKTRPIRTWCGTKLSTAYSTSSSLTLVFKTDLTFQRQGFRLEYIETPKSIYCPHLQTLTAEYSESYLIFPQNSYQHEPNLDCIWTIRGKPGKIVKIVVLRSHLTSSNDCSDNYVEIRKGDLDMSSQYGIFCGTSQPVFEVDDEQVHIILHTNSSMFERTFSLKYMLIKTSPDIQHERLAAVTYNKKELRPPVMVNPNTHYTWTLYTYMYGSASYIQAEVRLFDIAQSCSKYNVAVYDGSNDGSHLLGSWCRETEVTLQSSERHMFIEFSVEGRRVYGSSFVIYYIAINPGLPPDHEKSYVPKVTLIAGCVSVAIIVLLIGLCTWRCLRKKAIRRRRSPPRSRAPRQHMSVYSLPEHGLGGVGGGMFVGPPSYEDVVKSDEDHLPPPYDSLDVSSLRVNVVTAQNDENRDTNE